MVSQLVSEALELPVELIQRLLWFGAVYHCLVPPLPPPAKAAGMLPEDLARMVEATKAAKLKHGKNPALGIPRRVSEDVHVAGGYLRIHVHPVRFPAVYKADWARRIIVEEGGFVVVNKPAGVQVVPRVDNVRESLLACVEKVLGVKEGSLKPPHRLDVGTEGVVVLCKDTVHANAFRLLLSQKDSGCLQKHYRCLVASPPPLGILVHHVLENNRVAGEMPHTLVVQEGSEGCVRCELVVEQVEAVEVTDPVAAAEWGRHAYEVNILLKTGRTHQIRVQLAAIGCPLLGDVLYTSLYARARNTASAPAAAAAAAAAAAPTTSAQSSSPEPKKRRSEDAATPATSHATPPRADSVPSLGAEPASNGSPHSDHPAPACAAAATPAHPASHTEPAAPLAGASGDAPAGLAATTTAGAAMGATAAATPVTAATQTPAVAPSRAGSGPSPSVGTAPPPAQPPVAPSTAGSGPGTATLDPLAPPTTSPAHATRTGGLSAATAAARGTPQPPPATADPSVPPSGRASSGGSAQEAGERRAHSAHIPSQPTAVGPVGGGAAGAGGAGVAADRGERAGGDGTEALASDWCRKAQEDQQKAVALQAAKMVVVSAGGTILSPAVWDAGTPWWRQAETPRMVVTHR
ncbi:MAG: hypothetical protein WDW38_002391 [Sanguina aurantia]